MTDWIKAFEHGTLDDGEIATVTVGGEDVAVYYVDGAYFATADLCSHGHAKLSDGYLEGYVIECPLHAGLIDIRTGAGCRAPVTAPVATYATRIEGDHVFVASVKRD